MHQAIRKKKPLPPQKKPSKISTLQNSSAKPKELRFSKVNYHDFIRKWIFSYLKITVSFENFFFASRIKF